MYEIELSGSYTAVCHEFGVKVVRKKHGVIDICAREMIIAGADPEGLVKVTRSGTLCFHPRRLNAWAAIRVLESDNEKKPFRVRKHDPLGDRGEALGS